MLEQLDALARRHDFRFEVRDVDSVPGWRDAYNDRVPLLLLDGEVISEYFLDQATLLQSIGANR